MQYGYINLILINLKVHFITLYKFHPGNHISFLMHTLGTLLKHVADKNKTSAIILNLAIYILIQVTIISL